MNTLKIKTKKGTFDIENVYRFVTVGALLFVFYDDKKVKIPLDDVLSFDVFDADRKGEASE